MPVRFPEQPPRPAGDGEMLFPLTLPRPLSLLLLIISSTQGLSISKSLIFHALKIFLVILSLLFLTLLFCGQIL